MLNFKKICAILLLAVFCSVQDTAPVYAAEESPTEYGCSESSGLFSGLVKTGSDIFNNLRELIYVVAGFGIIAVAVGGFFGNLNWKWLGAIMIALIVIASTGELINIITGCEKVTKDMIKDTLTYPEASMEEGATQEAPPSK